MLGFLDSDTALGARVLDMVEVRSRAVMHNLANQNTPGFKRYEVEFESLLQRAERRGDDLGSVAPVATQSDDGPIGVNNVNSMDELAALDKVRILHEVFSRRVGGYFQHLKTAIRGQ
jgi:flagellar basal-body rod protein FlgB